MSETAIFVEGLSKIYRIPNIPKEATLKDIVVRRMRHEGSSGIVDALTDISFALSRGQVLGVVGRNGSGKTTLLRVLAGISLPDRGTIKLYGKISPLLALGAGFHPDLTGRENARIGLLSLGLTRAQTNRRMDEVIEFAEIEEFIDAPMRAYSVGMTMRLAFAVAVSVDPDILLLDEVLAVGDERFAQKCLTCINNFKQAGKTIVVVTHDTRIIETWCTKALWIHEGRVAKFGETAPVLQAYHALAPGAASEHLIHPSFELPEMTALNGVDQER